MQEFLDWRGIQEACSECQGSGQKSYPNTSTWRKSGRSGQAITNDVCDKCWGTGDARRAGTDLRALEAKLRDHEIGNLKRLRHVETLCSRCQGIGGRSYPSGSTWRGGMGTASYEWDVCDHCWGSGDEHRHWSDIREIEATEKQRIQEAAEAYWFKRTGAFLFSKSVFESIANLLEKETRRRKVDGDYQVVCGMLSRAIRGMGK